MTRKYTLFGKKNQSTKSDAELARIGEKYKNGVPVEIVYHLADKLAQAWQEENKEEEE